MDKKHNSHKTHKHDYYEYNGSLKRKHKRGPKGGIVFCRNDGNCVHFLEPKAMAIFRKIIRSGRQPIIREYHRTLANGREMVAIYPKPERRHRGFIIKTPAGGRAHILGDPQMPQKTIRALGRMVDQMRENYGKATKDPITHKRHKD